ncbi:MAG: STAS domain-containing protein [Balneolaceae bacterium]|jgi:anti-sigma B factor antagonist|nr:STAS domain-containing protein [Balneolaceae bacterium]MDR9446853.1 STAS domain-containing protein [Balneolaceae bacterium]
MSQDSFQIHSQTKDEFTILKLQGELDAQTAVVLEDEFEKLLSKQRYQVITNGQALQYIASAGLGVYMAYIERFRENGGDIKVTHLSERVQHVFDLLGLPKLVDVVDTDDDAMLRFQSTS